MATRETFSVPPDSFLYSAPSTPSEQLSFPPRPGNFLFQSSVSPSRSSSPTTFWMPLDEFATTWADFGSETAASSLALTATGTAFIALSWEASALRHHTWACQDYCQCRTRNAIRWYGQAMEDLTEASRQWSRVVMWLEKLANDEQQCSPAILERTRGLIGQAMAQQQRLWHLTQEVQQNLLAVGGGRDGHSPRQQPGRTLPMQQAGEEV
jgi:hypothetical protein